MYKSLVSLILCLCLFSVSNLFADPNGGIVKGRVTDKETQETIPGASVYISGTTKGTITNENGEFELPLPDGSYSLEVSFVSYSTNKTLPISVGKGKTLTLDVALETEVNSLDMASVVAVRRQSSEMAMLNSVKANISVSNGMSSQQIARTQDRDAAEVVKRIPGISIQDNRFVIVRGLSQRYNNVYLNNAPTPSSESDVRAFSFDVLPSSQIDNMVVIKSPMADMPADFSGGFIKVTTKNMPDSNSLVISYSASVLAETTFKDRYSVSGGSMDWLSFGKGSRQLPSNFPENYRSLDGANKASLSKSLNGNWQINQSTALPDQRFSMVLNRRFDTKRVKIGNFTAVNYSNTFKSFELFNARYGIYNTDNDVSSYDKKFTDQVYNKEVKLSALFNWSFLFDGGSRIEWSNFFNQATKDRTTLREGTNYSNNYQQQEKEFLYTSRTTYSTQLNGKHLFSNPSNKLNWTASYSFANKDEPDRKIITSYLSEDDSNEFFGQYGTNGNDIKRNFQKLDEHLLSGSVNYEQPLYVSTQFVPIISVGAYNEYKKRDFNARNFTYEYGNNQSQAYAYLPYYEIISNEYITELGTKLDAKTNKSDSYKVNNLLSAAYLSARASLGNLSFYAGLRVERNKMQLDGHESDGYLPVSVEQTTTDLFPSANVTYTINPKNLLRATYGRSVNRPEFREIAPYVYYDFDLFANFEGYPQLENAYAHNLDLRYEIYPSPSETFSVGVFYKSFSKPIEMTYFYTGGQLQYSFRNAKNANNIGVEFEGRKQLSFIGLDRFSLVANVALVKSSIHFDEASKDVDRAMQGQSPYLVNASLFYQHVELGLNMSMQYNIVGKRITVLGEANQDPSQFIPDTYEMPRHTLDFTFSKKIGSAVTISGGVKDILNNKTEFKQFPQFEKNGATQKREQTTRSFRLGQVFTLGASVRF